MRVLGIDPGTAACGFGVVEASGGRLRSLAHGYWRTRPETRLELRLRALYDGVGELLERFEPDAAVLEESFVGADARTALSVGQARGAVLVACAARGVRCEEYAPARVKQGVCGYGRADKAQVQRMVQILLGLREPPRPDHAADALAVAIFHTMSAPLLKLGAG